jgi:hypothetical protein
VPVNEYTKPGELIALHDAIRKYLDPDSGLAPVILAVVEGSLVPKGCTNRFRGITGYLFRSEALRKFRQVPGVTAPPEGFFTFKEAAAFLGVNKAVIRGLTQQGLLTASYTLRHGFLKLVSAKEVQQFAERYVATSILARRFHIYGGCLTRYLRESAAPLLAVPLPEAGRSSAFFIQKEVASRIELPPPAPR